MSFPVRNSKSPGNVDGFSAASHLEEELQEKRIKEVVLPILAVLAGFLLFPLDIAILFTAVVIFGVFICGNGPTSSSLSSPPDKGDPEESLRIHISPPPGGPSSGRFTPATPMPGTPSFRLTPGTVERMGVTHAVRGLSLMAFASPRTLAHGLTQMGLVKGYAELEQKGQRTPVLEEKTHRSEYLATPRNLTEDFDTPHN